MGLAAPISLATKAPCFLFDVCCISSLSQSCGWGEGSLAGLGFRTEAQFEFAILYSYLTSDIVQTDRPRKRTGGEGNNAAPRRKAFLQKSGFGRGYSVKHQDILAGERIG